jgi:hypothetical protein
MLFVHIACLIFERRKEIRRDGIKYSKKVYIELELLKGQTN